MKSKIFIIIFLTTSCILHSQSDVRIISSDFNSITIEYLPVYSDTSTIKINNTEYRNADLLFGVVGNYNEPGAPINPERRLSVGVPSEFGNTIEVLSTMFKEISGQLIPVPFLVEDTMSVSFEYKKNSEYGLFKSNDELVTFGEFGFVRDVPSQLIKVSPIKFDAGLNKIKLYSSIVFKINFGPSGSLSSNPADDLLDGVLINYDVAKYWNNQSPKKSLSKLEIVNSILANGKWVRFEAPEEGIYKITKSNLSLYGIDANTVNPLKIKIYNNSGKELPENINSIRPVDLVENAIIVVGQEDGKFDDSDYILFYGRGSSFWDYDNDGFTIRRFNHNYSSKNYFWITTEGENDGKRIVQKPTSTSAHTLIQTSTSAYADLEVDKINLGKSGRQFFGDDFSSSVTSRTYTNTLNGRISSSPISYIFNFIVGSSGGLTLNVSENGTSMFQQNLAGYGTTPYRVGYNYLRSFSYTSELPQNRSVLNFSVIPLTSTAKGYLDYFTISYEKELKAFNDNLLFFSSAHTGTIKYSLSGFSNSNIKVFDISDPANVMQAVIDSISGSECWFQFDESATQRSKYYAVGSDVFKTPINPTEIQNSNIRGELQGAKFIVITHKQFKDAANNLKTYKETQAPVTISTYVADIENIYNEFSGGLTDPTALRDYLKYTFDNWQIKPQYVLFLGKGTYDYKNIEGFNDNFIPTWQSIESLGLIDSYTTDDFFARVSGLDNVVDLAFGRITCTNSDEANNIINKIKNYELNSEKGNWRNLITLVSDDGCTSKDCNEGSEHTAPSEVLSNLHFPKSFDIKKIYSAAYPDVVTSQGRRKHEVNQAIIDAINQGTLFVNYIGHGSPELWAHEVIFEKSVTLPQLNNDEYFFLCAATCDFGYFDIPNYKSAAEAIMFLPSSGAIAGFSATRLVYSGYNHQLNYRFVSELFNRNRDTLNLAIPIGKAAFFTKQDLYSVNDQKYTIFGDPTLRLKVPQYPAVIDSINGQNLTVDVQIKALSSNKIDGSVLKPDNIPWSDFNGEGVLTIFDSERRVLLSAIGNYPVNMPGGVIFNGRVSINNGKFSEGFVVPKDISYENRNGKVIFYFQNGNVDGLGYTNKIIVGGTDSSISNDGKGPEIEIYFDDVAYNNGYLVNQNPNLIVKLSDETGLNTTGTGVGHKLEGILNQQLTNPIDFTSYFTGDLDAGGRSGSINYKFSALENGDHELLIKAWDVFNNFSEQSTFFSVVEGDDLVIREVFNYPNPFSDKTQFTFQQNLAKPIDVKIKVYTIAGRLIKEIEQTNVNDRFVVIDWDGRDTDGDQLANGTYLYKVVVKSVDGEFNKSVIGKLAVIK